MDDDGGMAAGLGFMIVVLLGAWFLLFSVEPDNRTAVEYGISRVKERIR